MKIFKYTEIPAVISFTKRLQKGKNEIFKFVIDVLINQNELQ